MQHKAYGLIVGLGFSGLLSGCAGLSAPAPMGTTALRPPVEVAAAATTVPFGLKVVDEVNDGERLHILASIESRTAWDPRRVMVRLVGLSGETVIGTSDYPLAGVVAPGDALPAGRSFDISLSIPVKGVTDYQLELLWGEESGPVRVEAAPTPLRLEDMTVARATTGCATPNCPVVYEVTGSLTNRGTATISRAALGVGFLPHGGGAGAVVGIPADEESIDLGALSLAPGTSRPVRLTVEQPRLASGGELTPVVRIVSFEAQEPVIGFGGTANAG